MKFLCFSVRSLLAAGICALSLLLPVSAPASDLITVKLGVLEALALLDSSSSDSYRQIFEATLSYGLGSVDSRLASCGYRVEVLKEYFDSSTKVSAKESGERLASRGAWVVFGPRRSDHFIAGVRGLGGIPIVSPMASSKAVAELRPPVFSMYPGVRELANAAFAAVSRAGYGTRYGSFVDGTCLACIDFRDEFARVAGGRMQRAFSIEGVGDRPNLDDLLDQMSRTKIDFLLLPNYSKFSGHTISSIQQRFPGLKVLGSDGWGDGTWSFLEAFGIKDSVQAISVRGGLPTDQLARKMTVSSLTIEVRGELLKPPMPALAFVRFLRKLSDDLCRARPKSAADLARFLSRAKSDRYSKDTGIAIYQLRSGRLAFDRLERSR